MAGGTQGRERNEVSQEMPAPGPQPGDRALLERFIARHDQAAFAALVARHGPMVLAVCRRVLGDGPDTEDAFQATFLILVRKAATIAQPELLCNWLFGVAARTARKARAATARRMHHERQAVPVASSAPPPDANWDDLRSLLDEELEHLPHKYRAPLVLCYLEGLTNEEAARRLGWPSGSISYRLARARELLRQRLGKRSAFAPVLFPALLDELVPESLPFALADQTVQTAMTLARDGSLASAASSVRWLVEEGPRTKRTSLLVVVLAALALGLLAIGACAASGALPSWLSGGSEPISSEPTGGGSIPESCH